MTYTVPSGVRSAIIKIAVAAIFVGVPTAAISVPGYAAADTPAVLPAPPPADPPAPPPPPPAPPAPPAPPQQNPQPYNPNDWWYNGGGDGGAGGGGGGG